MKNHVSCTVDTVEYPDGSSLPAIPYRDVESPLGKEPCHDCGTPTGGFHHPGCDMESCPNCIGQLISCGCQDKDEEDDFYEDELDDDDDDDEEDA